MKLNAVGVTSSDMKKTIEFYTILGFDFSGADFDADHIEPKSIKGSARLMIDSRKLINDLNGEDPRPGNHSSFAIELSNPEEVNKITRQVKSAGFNVLKDPWDAFWGQRYAVIKRSRWIQN